MERQAYKTKTGVTQYRPLVTEDEYRELGNENAGFCLACGEDAYGVEPDARRYECESCGALKVYGLEELLLMGLCLITETA